MIVQRIRSNKTLIENGGKMNAILLGFKSSSEDVDDVCPYIRVHVGIRHLPYANDMSSVASVVKIRTQAGISQGTSFSNVYKNLEL